MSPALRMHPRTILTVAFRGGFSLPRGAVRRREHRRSRHAREHHPGMGYRPRLVHPHPRHEPVLLLPVSFGHRRRRTFHRLYYAWVHADGNSLWARSFQIVAQLLSFPIGRLWARFLPNVKLFGVSLNPGPFNVKEHVLITIMATVGYQSAYAVSLQTYLSLKRCSHPSRRMSLPCNAYTTGKYTTSATSGCL